MSCFSKSSLDSIRSTNAAYLAKRPLVAVFTGGNSGIGDYTVRALAHHAAAGHGAHIYIVGRDQDAANVIINDHKTLSNVTFHFVKAQDLSLLKDVDRCCDEIQTLLRQVAGTSTTSEDARPRIDLLFMTHADMWLGKRRETPEGLDKTFSLMYYSRLRFVDRLLPLLDAAAAGPSPASATVVSVYAGGMEDVKKDLYLDDLALRAPNHYSYMPLRNHILHMKTMVFETLAERHPGVAFIHLYPGLVVTPGFDKNPMPLWFRATWKIVSPLAKIAFLKHGEVGERMMSFITSERFVGSAWADREKVNGGSVTPAKATTGKIGGGAYAAKYTGEEYGTTDHYDDLRAKGFQNKAWEHLMTAFKEIGDGRAFKQ